MAILGRIKKATSFMDFLNRFKKKSALKISDFLNVDNISFLESKNKNDIILELIDLLEKSKTLTQKDEFYKKIIEREKIISTGIGMGVAIPHAKLANLDDFFLAIGVQKEYKINWNSIDKLPIRLVFMIGGPEEKQNEYLQLLSKLTMALKNDHFRRNLLKATTKEEIIKLFRHF
ncbi:MAG: PTS system fructose-specific EIIABC component [Candidatus Anoxychlamydiales bacterium]|nr:PTS system fructose-specific EIIABC component [Candidatus Anoxychlamydiales bacterium]NGX35739.1 PTS system fructose-specific EIIABC component [Candidatus Anoxychlamydiales bacterium]